MRIKKWIFANSGEILPNELLFLPKSHYIISLNKKILIYQSFKRQEVNTYLILNKGPFCLLENSIENSE